MSEIKLYRWTMNSVIKEVTKNTCARVLLKNYNKLENLLAWWE